MQTGIPGLKMQQLSSLSQISPETDEVLESENDVRPKIVSYTASLRSDAMSTTYQNYILVDRSATLWAAFTGDDPDGVSAFETGWASTSRYLGKH